MSLYNDDELSAPSWINQDFLEKVLVQYENNEFLEVIKYDMSPASMKGDHYASIMFRCKVSYKFDKTGSILEKSLIIKTMPVEEGHKRDMLRDSQAFETEIAMYTKTLPKIEKILADCGEPTKLSAEIIYHSLEPYKVIILEDLCESGYNMVRGRYLNEDEVKAVYRKIAKLHAVSYMLGKSEDHKIVTQHRSGAFTMGSQIIDEFLTNGLNNFIDLLSCHEEFEPYFEKVKTMKPKIKEACKELYDAYKLNNGRGDIFVLNHGDFHMKNLMFKFNKKTHLEDLVMVDFQFSCFAPANIDMLYSQFMILDSDLRLKRNELMYYYFVEFTNILQKINYQGEMPLFSEFQMSSIKYRHFTLFIMSTILPMVVGYLSKPLEDLKDTDSAKLFTNPDLITMMYREPKFIEDIRNLLPILLREGYLD
ncbi:hypothetical protein FF38_13556 [Lucilia cuprina]|uniref:CHK kinase-like domain-containing protein n=1 Tax=Lucilia cuprina TaxID=7375 RepID=A0A0L0BX78_LUCCU|nr:hypothetical protein CVS40_1049 [Lucilia cuprina]KNC24663.1 hypothetical protein FF38_13556 [Lucilia cuprina]